MKKAVVSYYKGSVTGNLVTHTVTAPEIDVRENDEGRTVLVQVIGREKHAADDPLGYRTPTVEEFWIAASKVVCVHVTTEPDTAA